MKSNKDSATRIPLFFTIFVMIMIGSHSVIADSDYGEDDNYLGQIVDDYLNDDYINETVSVINNVTLECMELNYSSTTGMILEDFTTYTEQDEGGGITIVSAVYIDAVITRNTNRYVYYDFGVDYFKNFKHYGKFRQDNHQNSAWVGFSFFSNFLGNEQHHRNNNEPYVCMFIGGTAGNIGFREYTGAGFFATPTKVVVDDTFYWYKIEKIADVVHLDIYTSKALRDAEGNGDWYDEQLTLHVDYSFRYFYVCSAHDDNQALSMNVEYYDNYFNGTLVGYVEEGYYIEDLLNENRALSLLYDADIEANTNMTIAFFNESGVWVNHNNILGYDIIIDGLESLDLRDLNSTNKITRINMTTTNNLVTPRMNQLRYVTIIGEIENGDGNGIDNTPSIILGIFLILVALGLVYGVKK